MRISNALPLICLLAILPQRVELFADVSPSPTTQPAPTSIPLPGRPFGVVASRDGNWAFVAMVGGGPTGAGVAVLHQVTGQFQLDHVVPVDGGVIEMALTHDGKTLIGAGGDSVVMLDVGRMTSGQSDALIGKFSDGSNSTIYVNVTPDDKVLFVSDEGAATITVVDLARVRASGFDPAAIIGKIPVGEAPIALTFSPDGRWLYTTSEIAPPGWGWPSTQKPEGRANANQPGAGVPEGAVVVVDVARARVDPANSVVARVPAGGSPVRMTMSADGKRIFVTARGSNAVVEFDAERIVTDPTHARLAMVTVGSSPVPLALIQDGRTLVVGNSNRFAADANKPQTLSVLDVAKIGHSDATIGTITAGAFPREMCVTSDGKTLLVSNFGSDSVEVIDAQNPPVEGK
jgi:DNA-binding beta-propeller fold protein YncE